ncbi:MAG: GntR family transcriptional regulator [Massilia sp.]
MPSPHAFSPIDHSPVPLYAQVKERLLARILDGSYPAHAQLPAESELSSIFGVSRITVRQALSELQRDDIILKVPGKGTFVAPPKAFQELTQLEGFGEAMARRGHRIVNRVISHQTIAAPQKVAHRLGLATHTAVTEIRRVRMLDGAPLSLDVSYLPLVLGERLRGADLAGRDIFLIIENDYGIPLGHADLQIAAALCDEALARQLEVDAGSAVLRIERLTHNAQGQPIDFEYLTFRGDAFQYRLHLARQSRQP